MQIHHLSRGSKRALVLLLSLAIMLPLIALLPHYINWKEKQATQRAIDQSYTASVESAFTR
jgi:hypothetical protein